VNPSPTSPAPAPSNPARLLVTMGMLHAVLFVVSYVLLSSTPRVDAPDQELLDFYASPSRRRLVLLGLYVMPFAGIAFLWFSMALRGLLRPRVPRVAEMAWGLYLASSVLYVAIFFCGAAASSVVAVTSEHSRAPHDPLLLRQFPQLGATLLLVFGMRMAAMFTFTTSRLGLRVGVVPRWYAHVGVVTGLFLLLSTSTQRVLVLVFPVWLLGLCVHLWRGRHALAERAQETG